MLQKYKTSFLITLTLLFLLPVFFIPGGALSLAVAKSALLVFGVVVAILVFLYEVWRQGSISFPRHYFILVICLLPVVYLLSALLSTPSSLSLLGYNFEVGTFGFMLFGSILLVLVAMIFRDTSRSLQALVAFFVSISLVALFAAIKVIFGGEILVLGNFFGNMGNPIGNWTDLAVAFGLLSSFAALALGMIPMKFSVRVLVYGAFLLSTALLIVLNFPTAFMLTLGSSVLLILYFLKMEKHFPNAQSTSPRTSLITKPILLPIVLLVVSVVFLFNPTISATRGTISNVVSNTFRIDNIDVRPSFSATFDISKAVLSQVAFLGSGPNTFGHDWLIYKPVNVNTTPFWSVAFPFGAGFIPTQIASTGILGTALWLAFFFFLILLAFKSLSNISESRAKRFTLVSTLLVTIFLWISSVLYSPSATMLTLTFILTGLFVAVGSEAGFIPVRVINLRETSQVRFVSFLLMIIVAFGALSFGFAGYRKTASAYHFQKAVRLSNTPNTNLALAESELDRAVKLSPVDTYYVAISRINFAKAQAAANSATGTPEQNRAIFEESLRKSIEAARNAVSVNPADYQNWISLGMIYSALVSKPLAIEGSYENAQFAYNEAFKRNPTNPELPLLLASLELNNSNVDGARSFIRSSIALKEDYADAYLMLAQLEVKEGNTKEAIASTEQLAILMPENSGVQFELGLLKYSNKDYAGAKKAFEAALLISPDYANAKYYLGLTLAQLGELSKAQELFEALLVANPESEEVKLILEELRAGKTSFLGGPATTND